MPKVLLLETQYFGYEELIKFEIESLGYTVDLMDDRPSSSLLEKCILRVKPSLINHKVKKYFYNKILPKCKIEQYDIVLVILGQSFNGQMFQDLRKELPNTKFILYLWDSVANFPGLVDLSKGFDVTYSFDKLDCQSYGFEFLPLFYNHVVEEVKKVKAIKYDCSFIGTIKKGKLPYILSLKNFFDKKYKNNFFYLYLQSKLVYVYYKLFDKDFRKIKSSDFYYKKLDYKQTLEVFNSSRFVIDVPMKNQFGLPMRIFETLALGTKIITTNQDIKNYDFYCPQNIYIYDGSPIDFENEFFTTDYKPLDKNIIERYSIDNWLKTLLS